MPEIAIDWSQLDSKGEEFQNLCEEIFRARGYRTRQRARGGGDRGRDIVIIAQAKDIVDFERRERYWIECKFTQHPSLAANTVRSAVSFVRHLDLVAYVLMTNTRLSNDAYDYIIQLNRQEDGKLRYGVLEGEDIIRLIAEEPARYADYFPQLAQAAPAAPSSGATAQLCADSLYDDEVTRVRVLLKNRQPSQEKVIVKAPGAQPREITLAPFAAEFLSINVNDGAAARSIEVTALDDENSDIVVGRSLPDPRLQHVDSLYADPRNLVAALRRELEAKCLVLIEGSPGCGKTRLIREIRRKHPSVSLDLSLDDYRHSLVDHVAAMAIGVPITVFTEVDANEVHQWIDTADTDAALKSALTSYYQGASVSGRVREAVATLATHIKDLVGERTLFIDNIHRASHVDTLFLQHLTRNRGNLRIVLAARDGVHRTPDSMALFGMLAEREDALRVSLDSISVRHLISAHLDMVAKDDATRALLRKFEHRDSFQAYVLTLKAFKANGIIEQLADGRFLGAPTLSRPVQELYYDMVLDAIAPVRKSLGDDVTIEAIQCAAILGRTFAVELAHEIFGNLFADACTQLVDLDVMTSVPVSGEIAFDHELTHEVVYQRTPRAKRLALHARAHKYFEEFGLKNVRAIRLRAIHAFGAGNPGAAARDFAEAGEAIMVTGRGDEAYEAFSRASESLDVAERKEEPPVVDRDKLELTILKGQIESAVIGFDAEKAYHHARRLAVVGIDDPASLGLAYSTLALAFSDRFDGAKAKAYMEKAIEAYAGVNNSNLRIADCLSGLGNIYKKNFADPIACLRYQRTALALLRQMGNPLGTRTKALGLAGAGLIEAGRLRKALYWYRRAWEDARGGDNRALAASRLVSYAYLHALLRPKDVETDNLLNQALAGAERVNAMKETARANLNLANYLCFEQGAQMEAKLYLTKAETVARSISHNYILALCTFSRLMFERRGAAVFDDTATIGKRVLSLWPELLAHAQNIDIRGKNIISFFAHDTPDFKKEIARECSREMVLFLEANDYFSERMNETNPYFRAGTMITYY